MIYKVKAAPIGVSYPPFVTNWLLLLVANGEKVGNKIIFKVEEIKSFFQKEKVPHVADFLEENKVTTIEYAESDCEEG